MLTIALITCSVLLLAGGGSLALALMTQSPASIDEAQFVAAAVLIQGAFALFLVSPLSVRWRDTLGILFVAGEVGAAIIGSLAAVSGAIFNLNPYKPEYEFGPMALGALMAAHGFVGLFWAARNLEIPALFGSRQARHRG